MASSFGHALAAYTLGKGFRAGKMPLRFWIIGMTLSVIPDLDVIAFKFGIPYSHPLGHRGFSHSILAALILGSLCSLLFFRGKEWRGKRWWIGLYFIFATLSHGILDAMTSGGRGVGFFIPFVNDRIFFPFRPIQVAPIGVGEFFSRWGLMVLKSEMIWIGIPCVLILLLLRYRNLK